MKKIKHIIHFIAAFAAFCYCQGQAQAQAVFQRVYLDSKYENCVGAYGYSIIQTADSGFIIGGVPSGEFFDSTTLIKISSEGELEWRYAPARSAISVAELSNGDIVAIGPVIQPSGGTRFMALSSTGSLILDTIFSLPQVTEVVVSVIADGDSAVVVSAESDSLIVRKIGTDGHILWLTKLPNKGIELGATSPRRVLIERKDDYLIVSDSEVFSLSRSGSIIWQKGFEPGIGEIRSFGQNGEFAIQILYTIVHCDSSGSVLDSITTSTDGFVPSGVGYVVTGLTYQALAPVSIVASSMGWSHSYASPEYIGGAFCSIDGTPGWNGCIDIIHTFDGGYAVTGMFDAPTSQAPSVGGPGMYVIKTDSLGNTDSLEIDTFASQSQSSVSVTPQPELSLKAFPDPITSLTTISFTLPAASQATLTLTDAAGRERPLLPAQYLSAGQHEVTWDASNYPSGVYLCRLWASGESATRRVVVMH